MSAETPVDTPTANGDARPLLVVEHLTTIFDTPRGQVRAVDDVSFTLDRGATLGIVGESGSGKSVLVRSIMNLLASNATIGDDSRVLFDGRDLRRLPPREAKHFWGTEMAMVFQDPMTALNPVKTIGDQITETIRYHLGVNRRTADEMALDLLNLVKIPAPRERLSKYPHELSGGMRQRIVIAIALSCEPRLLIADEPTTALDVTIQREILDLLYSLQHSRGMAMILITHDLGVVAGQADRVAVMYGGQLQESAATEALFNDVQHPYTEALLNSIPKLDEASHTRLNAIAGSPPNLAAPPAGCRFAPRCRYATSTCHESIPPLVPARNPDHLVRCFLPLGGSPGEVAPRETVSV